MKFKKLISLFMSLTVVLSVLGIITCAEKAKTIQLSASELVLHTGESEQLVLENYSGNVKWSYSGKGIITVDKSGTVTGKKEGTAYVYATGGRKKYKCAIKVSDEGITADKYAVTINKGESTKVNVDTDGAYISIKSTSTKIAYGNKGKFKNGKFTLTIDGRSVGSAVITVYEKDNADNCVNIKVTVEQDKYTFRTKELFDSHFKKHGDEFGDISQEEYLEKANELISSSSKNVLTKTSDDNDKLYFNKKTGEFLVLSADGYIRTYFIPDDGIDYWNRQ